jgi:hypothetical protein
MWIDQSDAEKIKIKIKIKRKKKIKNRYLTVFYR